MVFATFLIGCIPESDFKRWLNRRAFKMTFRILARSLSVVLTIHNQEFRPHAAGICVANHTTPVDVVIMSTESCFSLVSALFSAVPQSPVAFLCCLWVSFFQVLNAVDYNVNVMPMCAICVDLFTGYVADDVHGVGWLRT